MFKHHRYPKAIILQAVYFKLRFTLSYRDIEELLQIRGVNVDHSTIQRWVFKFSPAIEKNMHKRKFQVGDSWRMDETYIKVKGKWCYFYRAIDKHGDTLDFWLSETRDEAAATQFFKRTIENNGLPEKVVIDKSGANLAGLKNMNLLLILYGCCRFIEIIQIKYLNNIIEQDHRFIKRITKPMQGFKAFASAQATLAGIELAHMIRKKQFNNQNQNSFQTFTQIAG